MVCASLVCFGCPERCPSHVNAYAHEACRSQRHRHKRHDLSRPALGGRRGWRLPVEITTKITRANLVTVATMQPATPFHTPGTPVQWARLSRCAVARLPAVPLDRPAAHPVSNDFACVPQHKCTLQIRAAVADCGKHASFCEGTSAKKPPYVRVYPHRRGVSGDSRAHPSYYAADQVQ